jgi:peptidoglycan/LPS O-acetylase OafA/YrhL
MMILQRLLQPFDVAPFVLIAIIAIASVVVGALLYGLVESPFMAIRARWLPTSFSNAAGRRLRAQPATAQTPSGGY